MADENGDGGWRQRDAQEYVEALESGCETTSEIAEAVDVTSEGARQRLHALREEGLIEGRKVGGVWLWQVVDGGDSTGADDE